MVEPGRFAFRSNETARSGAVLSTDLETSRSIIAAVQKIEESRPSKVVLPAKFADDQPSPLLLWERIEPQALRYKYHFEYYLGFAY